MYCPHCGAHNDGTQPRCSSCGGELAQPANQPYQTSNPYQVKPAPHAHGGERPKNHLIKAILATVFCCWPLGIVAIVFAAQVNAKYEGGDYAGAVKMSKQADTWGNISIGLGLVVIVVYVILMIASVGAGGI